MSSDVIKSYSGVSEAATLTAPPNPGGWTHRAYVLLVEKLALIADGQAEPRSVYERPLRRIRREVPHERP